MPVSRRRMRLVLDQVGDEPVTSSEIGKALQIDTTQTGAALKALYDAGLVWRDYEKRRVLIFGGELRRKKVLCYRITEAGKRVKREAPHGDIRISHETRSADGEPGEEKHPLPTSD